MPERHEQNPEVTVIFRRGDSLVIPPNELPRTLKSAEETFEETAVRLANSLGIAGSVDYYINPSLEDNTFAPRGYLVESCHDELGEHPHLVENDDILRHVSRYYGNYSIESKLFRSAFDIVSPKHP